MHLCTQWVTLSWPGHIQTPAERNRDWKMSGSIVRGFGLGLGLFFSFWWHPSCCSIRTMAMQLWPTTMNFIQQLQLLMNAATQLMNTSLCCFINSTSWRLISGSTASWPSLHLHTLLMNFSTWWRLRLINVYNELHRHYCCDCLLHADCCSQWPDYFLFLPFVYETVCCSTSLPHPP